MVSEGNRAAVFSRGLKLVLATVCALLSFGLLVTTVWYLMVGGPSLRTAAVCAMLGALAALYLSAGDNDGVLRPEHQPLSQPKALTAIRQAVLAILGVFFLLIVGLERPGHWYWSDLYGIPFMAYVAYIAALDANANFKRAQLQ